MVTKTGAILTMTMMRSCASVCMRVWRGHHDHAEADPKASMSKLT